MSQLASPYQIGGNLNFTPGGNPLLGAAGGLPGLAMNYGASYNSALQANQTSYNNILQGYQTNMANMGQGLSSVGNQYGSLMGGIQNTLGANYGVPGVNGAWGIAAPAASAINKLYSAQTGQQFDAQGNPTGTPTGGSIAQQLINSGLGKSTAMTDANRGAFADYGNAIGSLGANLAQTYAGYQANIGEAYLGQRNQATMALANEGDKQLNWMNSIQIPYPNASLYAQLYQQQGQASQAAAAQQQQMDIFRMGLGRGGGGGGGASVGAAPRGGTYGSGGGGFPSGGAGTSVGGPSGSGNWQGNSSSNNYYTGGGGGGGGPMSINPSGAVTGPGAYDPWSTNVDNPSGNAGSQGFDPSAGNFGDLSGHFGFSGLNVYA